MQKFKIIILLNMLLIAGCALAPKSSKRVKDGDALLKFSIPQEYTNKTKNIVQNHYLFLMDNCDERDKNVERVSLSVNKNLVGNAGFMIAKNIYVAPDQKVYLYSKTSFYRNISQLKYEEKTCGNYLNFTPIKYHTYIIKQEIKSEKCWLQIIDKVTNTKPKSVEFKEPPENCKSLK